MRQRLDVIKPFENLQMNSMIFYTIHLDERNLKNIRANAQK